MQSVNSDMYVSGLLYNSIAASAKAFKALAREEKAQTGNGHLKKLQ